MRDIFYVTTPIYYVNDVPHIGHAYTTIAADVLARYHRMKGDDTLFATGTDEHGQKIQRAAQDKGMTAIQLADKTVVNFQNLWKALKITNDDFIRTTEPRHEKVVQYIFKNLIDKGDVYKGTYEGQYCVPCETFWPESQLDERRVCPDCGRKLELVQEESYFFKMSKYEKPLLEFYEKNKDAILPKTRYNEIVSFIKSGLKDQSISRTTLDWGIPIPGDEKHVVYVWFDALINYLTVCGYPEDSEKWEKYWPNVVHLVGKDILRFHSVVWPAMLLALGVNPPKLVFAHGWWTSEGEKMSKSKGNVVDPFKMVELYGVDPFRYFVLREVPFGLDGDYSIKALIGRINSDLANDLGNLLSRTVKMVNQFLGGAIAKPGHSESLDDELSGLAESTISAYLGCMERCAFDDALKAVWVFVSRANKYIDQTEPWKLAKSDEKTRLPAIMYNLCESLRLAALMLYPIIPDSSQEIWNQLGVGISLEKIAAFDDEARWGRLKIGALVTQKGRILFPRIEDNVRGEVEKKDPVETKKEPENKKQDEMAADDAIVSIEDFKKVQFRVAKVLSVEDIPKADKLYKLRLDIGGEERTIVSGIREWYKPEELVGKKIIVIVNLKPAKLRGVMSNGMLLAAQDGEDFALLTVDREIAPGSRIS